MKHRELLISLAVISGVIGIILYSPLANHFTYPSAGEDGANYLLALQNGEQIHNYGIYLLKPLMWSGLSALPALSIFYYLIISIGTIVTWLITRHYGLKAAIIGTPVVMLGNYGLWKLWFSGAVLGIGGLLIFTFGAYLCLIKAERHKYWYIPFTLLLTSGILFHKSSGLIMLAVLILYALTNKKYLMGIITAGTALFGLFLWLNDMDLINSIALDLPWLNLTILAYILAMATIVWFKWIPLRMAYHMQDNLTQLIILHIFVLSLGTVLLLNNALSLRLFLDGVTILSILLVTLIAKGLLYIPLRYQGVAIAIILAWPLMTIQEHWLSNYTAVQNENIMAYDRINDLATARDIVVSSTYGESVNIMKLYLAPNVKFNLDPNKADIILYRTKTRPFNEENGTTGESVITLYSPVIKKFISLNQ